MKAMRELLTGLITAETRISPVGRSELVLSDIASSECSADEESLNGEDVDGVDDGVAIHVSRRELACSSDGRDVGIMKLHG